MHGSNFVTAITRVKPRTLLEGPELSDEHMVLLHDTDARVEAGRRTIEVRSRQLLIVAPGKARATTSASLLGAWGTIRRTG